MNRLYPYILLIMLCCATTVSAQEMRDSVELLIKELITSHKRYDYHELDFYHFTKYERRDIDLNDIDPLNVNSDFMKRICRIRRKYTTLALTSTISSLCP